MELCCGSKSFANYLRVKFPRAIIVTLDIVDSAHPTHVADVTKWSYRDYYPIGWFTIVWASPPCTEYSPAKTMEKRKKTKGKPQNSKKIPEKPKIAGPDRVTLFAC